MTQNKPDKKDREDPQQPVPQPQPTPRPKPQDGETDPGGGEPTGPGKKP